MEVDVMKAQIFYKHNRPFLGVERPYMILRLSAEEQAKLKIGGGFDKIINPTVTLISECFLKGEKVFSDGTSAYLFKGLLKEITYVYEELKDAFKCECEIKHTKLPSFEKLLAGQHDVCNANQLQLYVNFTRKPQDQLKGRLYATFRAPRETTLKPFLTACKKYRPSLTNEFKTERVAVVRGYLYSMHYLRAFLSCAIDERASFSYDDLLLCAYAK